MSHEEELKYLEDLAIRLKSLRKEKGFAQYDCGVDERTIRRIESPKENFNPSYLTLVEISNHFGMTISELLNFK